jgi:hypothetical protein
VADQEEENSQQLLGCVGGWLRNLSKSELSKPLKTDLIESEGELQWGQIQLRRCDEI